MLSSLNVASCCLWRFICVTIAWFLVSASMHLRSAHSRDIMVGKALQTIYSTFFHLVLFSLCAFLGAVFVLPVLLSSFVYLLYLMFICCKHMCICFTLCVFVVLLMCICCISYVYLLYCVYCWSYFRCRTAG